MWIRSVDERLVNLAVVEAVELLDVFPEDASPEAIEAGTVPADGYEIVAYLPSGWEAVLFGSEHAEEAERALAFLTGLLATDEVSATLGGGRVRGLAALMERGAGVGSN